MVKIEATNCIAIPVKEYTKALDFYENVMKMEVNQTGEDETAFQSGDLTIFIENNPNGQVLLEFRVEDIETAKKALLNADCQITKE